MKKFIIILLCIILFFTVSCILIFKRDDSNLSKVTVAEVTHSIFYAPQYIAISNGYFEEEGIDVELVLTPGADKVLASVLSGDADIGLCGPEATIYVYNGGEEDYAMTFAGLTQKDGSFLVSRENYENFTLENLSGKHILAGRKGGMPAMVLEYAIKKSGIDTTKDLNFDTSIAFAALDGTFIGGTGDFVSLFEPNATNIEKEGYGYVVTSLATLSENIPYTAYNAKRSFIEDNNDLIEGFTKAIKKAQNYVYETDAYTIALNIYEFFPDMTLNELTESIKNYQDNEVWAKSPIITEESFDLLQEIVIEAGELKEKVPYNKLIDNTFSNNLE